MVPEFIEEHHPSFGSVWIAIIVASYMGAFLLSTPIIGKISSSCGKRCIILSAIFIQVSSTFGLASAGLFTDSQLFFWTTVAMRMCQGIGDAMIMVNV